MAEYTKNYRLQKPGQDDFYDIDVQNGNMDLIDAAMKENADNVAAHTHSTGDVGITYGTESLVAGESALANGKIYLRYE